VSASFVAALIVPSAPVTAQSAPAATPAPAVTPAPQSSSNVAPLPQSTVAPQAIASPSSAAPSQAAPLASPGAIASPGAAAPGAVASPGAMASPGSAAAPAQPQTAGNTAPTSAGPAALPPPPVPAVLPAVPSFPALSAPLTAIPNGDLVGVAQPFVGLSLHDAIAMALQRNTDLALSQSNRRIDHFQIVAAKGAYDVNFQLIPSYSHDVTPVSTPFDTSVTGGPVTTDTLGATAQLRGLTGTGGTYTVGVTGNRTTSNNAYNSYNPYYETALQFSFTQPLARGRAIDQPRLQVALSRINADLADSEALQQASNTIVQVQNSYYDLYSAWQNVAIQEEGLRNATAQAASNARLAARGAVAPTDIIEANTQVNVFQDNVFAAIQNVQRVQIQLKTLLLANPGDPVWFANLVPTTPVAQVPAEPSLDALIASAIANRPEITQARVQRARSVVDLAYARDQLRPQVDLKLGATNNGFAGDPLNPGSNPLFSILGNLLGPGGLAAFPGPPAYQTGKLGQSFQTALDGRFPSYESQLTISIPIGNHTARANYSIAQEQQRQVQIDETAVVQRIRGEAVNAIQGLREAQYRVISARAARIAAVQVLQSEQRRFAAGTSTTFLVLQRQLDVANQEGRELQAQTDLDKAIVELDRVSGGIFANNGVDLTTVGGLTENAAGSTSVLPPPTTVPAPAVRRSP
jgi:HAE1 family hydrophobic/amphiphilic exporter-1